MRLVSRIIKFFKEVRSELAKVVWPTRAETVRYTTIVLVSVGIVASLIWVVDTMFSRVLRLIIG